MRILELAAGALFGARAEHFQNLNLTAPEATTLRTPPLDYSTISYSELRTFAIARTADHSSHKRTRSLKKTTKDKLARLLRRLDANPSIRFFALPPELREQIYGFFLHTFDGRVEKKRLIRRLRLVSEDFCREAIAVWDRTSSGTSAEIPLIGHIPDMSDVRSFMGPLYRPASCDTLRSIYELDFGR